ncbi:MAG: substrate-binding domain-containing protein [Thermoflexales bacterium]|nr:substrate-binding domain-containing protein [Thermoflexales bacterium]
MANNHAQGQTSPPQRSKRLTVGFLTHAIHDEYGLLLWNGVFDALQTEEVNLVCYPGWDLYSARGFERQANVVYDLAHPDIVDGLVLSGGVLSNFAGMEGYRRFCQRYQSLPLASIAVALEGVPSVVVDNRSGIHEAVTHLITVHGCRRIAFFRAREGNPEAEARYDAYVSALAEHGLPLDPQLVSPPGNFDVVSGVEATRVLLDERGLRPQLDFDAIVTPSDNIALGTLSALRERGIHVPRDIALTGFDDVESVRFSIPPLTTVRQPTREQAMRAAQLVLAQLRGEQVPEVLSLSTQLVVRQSCGCMSPMVIQAAAEPMEALEEPLGAALSKRRAAILSEMTQASDDFSLELAFISRCAEQLLDALIAEWNDLPSKLAGSPEPLAESSASSSQSISWGFFLSALRDVLRRVIIAGGNVVAWQSVVSSLRRHVLPYLGDSQTISWAESLWGQARVLVGEATQLARSRHEMQAAQQTQVLREISQALITTFDVEELAQVLAAGLPRLGLSACYLSLYENAQAPSEQARLVMASCQDGEAQVDGQRFPSYSLAPGGMIDWDAPHHFVVEPLYFRENQIGFALFEAEARYGMIYEALRGQLSSALQGALILEARQQAEAALEKAYREVEDQVKQRTAELQREIADRQLAQEDNLRLQEGIIEAQRQALQELSSPIIPVMENIIVMPLIGSIDTFRAKEITRSLLAGIRQHQVRVVILDITGVPIVDTGVANHLNKTIQAARLKGALAIVTGMSDAVAETIVDLGVDWSGIETLADLKTGLRAALERMGMHIEHRRYSNSP